MKGTTFLKLNIFRMTLRPSSAPFIKIISYMPVYACISVQPLIFRATSLDKYKTEEKHDDYILILTRF